MHNSMALFTFSVLDGRHPLFDKFGQKNQNCQFKLKFGTSTNLNMQNLMALFTFPVLDGKHPFFGKFGPKNQNCQFKLKFGT